MLRISIANVKQEAAQIFNTTKGKLVLGLLWVWTVVPGLYRALSRVEMDDRQQQAHLMALIKAYDIEVAKHLFLCPLGLLFTAISIFELAPLAALALTFLGASSSGQARSSAEAWSISGCRDHVVRETLGAWGAFCAVSLAVFLPVAVAEVVADQYPVWLTLKWTAELYLGSCAVAAVYLALWQLSRSYFRTRLVALLASVGLALLLLIAQPFVRLKASTLAQLFPGSLTRLLLSGAPNLIVRALLIAAAWVVVSLALSAYLQHARQRKPRAALATGSAADQVAPPC
jgi:hypothetical protein